MLKKIFLGILLVLVLILVFHSFVIGTFVKPQVEQQVSKALGAKVKINVLSVRLWPGRAAIYGFKIKNPAGFSDQQLLDLGSASASLDMAALIKQFSSGTAGPKLIVIDHIKIKNLKLFIERIAQGANSQSNLEKLTENLKRPSKSEAEKPVPSGPAETKKPLDLKIELKQFDFVDGAVTVIDHTIGPGFEYSIDKINLNVKNIFFPAKPANELVETLDASAEVGKDKPGKISLTGNSNFMAGANADAKFSLKGVALSDFNAFLSNKPVYLSAGIIDLDSTIKISNSELVSQHQLKVSSMELKNRTEDSALLDLPMQTLIATLSRLPSLDIPFELNGNLKNPEFKIIPALRAAILAAIQKVLASGLGELKGELTGVAKGLQSQAAGIAAENSGELTDDAKKLVQGLSGEARETLDGGLKKLSGFLSQVKKGE